MTTTILKGYMPVYAGQRSTPDGVAQESLILFLRKGLSITLNSPSRLGCLISESRRFDCYLFSNVGITTIVHWVITGVLETELWSSCLHGKYLTTSAISQAPLY